MTKTPSKRRRVGREAFYPGGDPKDHIPPRWWSDSYKQDFVDGWNEAEANYGPTPEFVTITTEEYEKLLDDKANFIVVLRRVIEFEDGGAPIRPGSIILNEVREALEKAELL